MESFLTVQEMVELKRAHKACKNLRKGDRIKAILLLNEGYSYKQVARILLLDDSTIRRYKDGYKTDGLKGLWQNRYKGKPSRLTVKQEQFLKLHLRARLYQTSAEIVIFVEAKFGIKYSIRGLTKTLHRLGFVYKKPKVVPGKANKEAQEAFLKEYYELKENKDSEDRIYFADGSHPHHNAIPAYGWIEKGSEKHLKTNTGRQRLNLNGALNSENVTDVEILAEETINADAVIRLFERLLAKHTTGLIYLIIDNARYYRAKKVKQFVNDHPRIKLKFLPPYSPNLNLIERLWLIFQKKILYNKHYYDFQTFENRTMHFFQNLHRYRGELESLLIDNFRTIGA